MPHVALDGGSEPAADHGNHQLEDTGTVGSTHERGHGRLPDGGPRRQQGRLAQSLLGLFGVHAGRRLHLEGMAVDGVDDPPSRLDLAADTGIRYDDTLSAFRLQLQGKQPQLADAALAIPQRDELVDLQVAPCPHYQPCNHFADDKPPEPERDHRNRNQSHDAEGERRKKQVGGPQSEHGPGTDGDGWPQAGGMNFGKSRHVLQYPAPRREHNVEHNPPYGDLHQRSHGQTCHDRRHHSSSMSTRRWTMKNSTYGFSCSPCAPTLVTNPERCNRATRRRAMSGSHRKTRPNRWSVS